MAPFSSLRLPKAVIWEAWCLHFGSLQWHFAISGAPWGTMAAAGWTRGGPESVFLMIGDDLGTHFWNLLGSKG